MAVDCLCDGSALNLGKTNCVENLTLPVKLGLEYRNANDGTLNGIDLTTDTIDASFMNTWINQADESKRLFMTPEIILESDERGDPITETLGRIDTIVAEGLRDVSFFIVDGASPSMVKAINSFSCKDMTVYTFTETSQIGGNGKDANALRGRRIAAKTILAKWMPKTETTVAKIMVTFTLAVSESDGDIAFIPSTPDKTGVGYMTIDPLDYDGLIDTNIGAASSISTTGFVTEIDFNTGAHGHKQPFQGGLVADFTLEEISPTPAPIVITSVTESPDGTYTFVFPAETAADVLRLTGSKDGYSFNNTIDITIP